MTAASVVLVVVLIFAALVMLGLGFWFLLRWLVRTFSAPFCDACGEQLLAVGTTWACPRGCDVP